MATKLALTSGQYPTRLAKGVANTPSPSNKADRDAWYYVPSTMYCSDYLAVIGS